MAGRVLCMYNGEEKTVLSASITQTGGRAVDSVTLGLIRNETIEIGDIVYVTLSPIDMSNMVGLYHLDDDRSQSDIDVEVVNDYSPTSNNSTSVEVQFVRGMHNKFARFNGTTNQVTMPNHTDQVFGTKSFSVLFECSFTSSTEMPVVSKYDTNSSWKINVTGGKIKIYQKDGAGAETSYLVSGMSAINDGNEHHVCVIREYNVNWRVFVDGIKVDTITSGSLSNTIDFTGTSPFYIGKSATGGGTGDGNFTSGNGNFEGGDGNFEVGGSGLPVFYAGDIDEVVLFSRPLFDNEVYTLGAVNHHITTVFGGFVASSQDYPDKKLVVCDSWGRILRDKFVESKKYYLQTVEAIVEDLVVTGGTSGSITTVTGIAYDSDSVTNTTLESFVAFGNVSDIVTELARSLDYNFYTTYNKLFRFEKPSVSFINELTINSGVNAIRKEWTVKDNEIYNIIYVIGSSRLFHRTEDFSNYTTAYTTTTNFTTYKPTVSSIGTKGTTQYDYYIVAVDSSGKQTIPSAVGYTSVGNSTLTSVNYNKVSYEQITPSPTTVYLLRNDFRTLLNSQPYSTVGTDRVFNDIGDVPDNVNYNPVSECRLSSTPLSVKVSQFNGTTYIEKTGVNDYSVDTQRKSVYLKFTPTNTVRVEYDYEDPIFVKTQDSMSINIYGERGRKFTADWISDISTARKYANGLLEYYKNPRVAGVLVLGGIQTILTEGTTINVVDNFSTPVVNQVMDIKTITWKYPEGKTEVEVGTWIPTILESSKDMLLRIKDLERRSIDVSQLKQIVQIQENISISDSVTLTQYTAGNPRVPSGSDVRKLHLMFNQNLTDQSGNSNTVAVTTGTAKYTTGKSRYAFHFDGTNRVTVTNPSVSTNDLTVALWVYQTANANWHDYVTRKAWSGAGAWNIYSDVSGNVTFGIRRGDNTQANVLSSNTLNLNAWNCIVATYDFSSGNQSIYLNGVETNRTEASLTLDNSTDVTVGEAVGGSNYRIDEVQIYNIDITDTQADNLRVFGDIVANPIKIGYTHFL